MVIIFLTFSPGLAVATKPATCALPENPIKITGLLSAIFLIASYSALITSSAKRAVVQCLFEQIGLLIYWHGRAKYMTFGLSSPKASSRTKVPRGVWSCVALPRALKAITVAFYIYFIRSSRIGNLLPAGKSKIPCFNLFIHKFSRHLDCRTPGQKRQYFYDTFGSLQKDYIGLFIKIPEGF